MLGEHARRRIEEPFSSAGVSRHLLALDRLDAKQTKTDQALSGFPSDPGLGGLALDVAAW
jgi:hypothetical protein